MSPVPGATVTAPSLTVHLAWPPPLTETHWLRSLPSNSTMASEGASEGEAPGVTIFGCGIQNSVDSGVRLSVCAKQEELAKTKDAVRLSLLLIGIFCGSEIISNLVDLSSPVL